MYLSASGPTTSYFHATARWEQLFSTVVDTAENISVTQTIIGNNSTPGPVASAVTAAGGTGYWFHMQGRATFTANGNISLAQATSGAGAFTVKTDSMLVIYPQG